MPTGKKVVWKTARHPFLLRARVGDEKNTQDHHAPCMSQAVLLVLLASFIRRSSTAVLKLSALSLISLLTAPIFSSLTPTNVMTFFVRAVTVQAKSLYLNLSPIFSFDAYCSHIDCSVRFAIVNLVLLMFLFLIIKPHFYSFCVIYYIYSFCVMSSIFTRFVLFFYS